MLPGPQSAKDVAPKGNSRFFVNFGTFLSRGESTPTSHICERSPPSAVQRRDVWVSLVLGLVLAVASLGYLAASEDRNPLLVLLAVEIAAGREAGIPAGMAAGLDWKTAAAATTLIEWTSLFLGFPLLALLGTALHRVALIERLSARAQRFAAERPDVGILTLGALTLMPFLPIGALTSVLIGEILRLPTKRLLPVLAASLLLANIAFGAATAAVLDFVPNPRLVAAGMAGLLVLGAGVAALVHRRAAS